MFRDRPYDLVVELARGKLNQVRNQYADWHRRADHSFGEVDALIKQVARIHRVRSCSIAPVPNRTGRTSRWRWRSRPRRPLIQRYQDQVFRLRHQRQPKLDTALGLPHRFAAAARSGRCIPPRVQRRMRSADLANDRADRIRLSMGGCRRRGRLGGRNAISACSPARSSTSPFGTAGLCSQARRRSRRTQEPDVRLCGDSGQSLSRQNYAMADHGRGERLHGDGHRPKKT